MYQIGILQLTQNLDDAVQGFKYGLAQNGISANFRYLNADGNLSELPKLAAKLADLNVDLIFACSTPAAKAAIELTGNIPVVFTPVFDPVGAQLVKSMELPGGKATGMSGMVTAEAKVAFIQRLLPKAKKIGVLYHEKDPNALLELGHFQKAAANNFDLTEFAIADPADLSRLGEMLPPDLDALFLPIGRIVEENFATVVYYTDAINLPVIASHAPNVPSGALAALTASHHKLGAACADKAIKILAGTNPNSIPVGIVEQPDILLNAFAAQNLDIELPAALLSEAKEIFE